MLLVSLCGKVVPRLAGRCQGLCAKMPWLSHVCFRARAVDYVIQRSSDAGARDLKKFMEGRTRTLRNCLAYVLDFSLC